jgi:hypothetical protein
MKMDDFAGLRIDFSRDIVASFPGDVTFAFQFDYSLMESIRAPFMDDDQFILCRYCHKIGPSGPAKV